MKVIKKRTGSLCCLRGLFFDPEYGDIMFLRNVRKFYRFTFQKTETFG
jgi:hypothetical protein